VVYDHQRYHRCTKVCPHEKVTAKNLRATIFAKPFVYVKHDLHSRLILAERTAAEDIRVPAEVCCITAEELFFTTKELFFAAKELYFAA